MEFNGVSWSLKLSACGRYEVISGFVLYGVAKVADNTGCLVFYVRCETFGGRILSF